MGSLRAYAYTRERLEREIERAIDEAWEEFKQKQVEEVVEGKYTPWNEERFIEALAFVLVVSFYVGAIDIDDLYFLENFVWPFPESELDQKAKRWLLRHDRIAKSLVGTKELIRVKRLIKEKLNTGPLGDVFRKYSEELSKAELTQFRRRLVGLINKALEEGLKGEELDAFVKLKAERFTKNKMKLVTRTEITRAYNAGLLAGSFYNPKLVGYRFQAVLDNRTSQMCRERHGMFIPREDTYTLALNTPPLHPNCRSRLVPVYGSPPLAPKYIYEAQTPPIKRDIDVEFTMRVLSL